MCSSSVALFVDTGISLPPQKRGLSSHEYIVLSVFGYKIMAVSARFKANGST